MEWEMKVEQNEHYWSNDLQSWAYEIKDHSSAISINILIIHMKKLLDFDWAVQFKCNTSAKSVIPVQKV